MRYQLLIGGVCGVTLFSLCISVPLYLLVLAAIISHRNVDPFHSCFFTLFVCLGFTDIGCYLLFLIKKAFFLGFVPSFLTPFNQPNPYLPFLYYPFWVFAFLQYELTFFMTLNRYFNIVMHGYYLVFWTRTLTRWILGLCVVLSCSLALPVLWTDCQISEYMAFQSEGPYQLHYGPYTTDQAIDRYLKRVWAVHVYGLIITSIVFYAFMLRKLRISSSFLMKSSRRQVEFQMFCVSLAVFIMNLAFTVYFILRDIVLIRTNNSHLHEWILYFMADIYDLPNGYILLFMSDRVRKIVANYLRCRFERETQSSIAMADQRTYRQETQTACSIEETQAGER